MPTLKRRTAASQPTPTPPATEHDLELARRQLAYSERRLQWIQRLARDERDSLAGVDGATAEQITELYQQARDAWAETMPAHWTPAYAPVEPLSFQDAVAVNGQTRQVERLHRAGEPDPDTGELIPSSSLKLRGSLRFAVTGVAVSGCQYPPTEPVGGLQTRRS